MKKALVKIFTSRFTYMFIVGAIISAMLHAIQSVDEGGDGEKYSLIMSIGLTFLIWEGNLWLDRQFAKKLPWSKNPFLRIVIQVSTNVIYSAGLIYSAMLIYNNYVCTVPEPTKERFLSLSIIIGTLVSLLLLTVEFGKQFFIQWKLSLIEVERYKKESIEAQLEVLKAQINPHFLFNNLSVLSSLVYIDQDKAVEFINQFSKVYRYVIESNNKELVTLNTEMEFIQSYIFLLKIRFGANINFNIEVDTAFGNYLIPPMALEIILENTIKHNEVSIEKPLFVSIQTTKQNYLIISNNLQLRNDVEKGTQLGLKNIKQRYIHYTDQPVHIEKKNDQFVVQIPLLPKQ
jgi:two-component system LytT family sensor kinase